MKLDLFVLGISKNASGKSLFFILSNYEEVTSIVLFSYIKNKFIKNLQIVRGIYGQYIRAKANSLKSDNLKCLAIQCNQKDYLFFNGFALILKSINGHIKKIWIAKSGMPGSTYLDQNKKDFGPLPEGEYLVKFSETLDFFAQSNLWDKAKWIIKSPNWGFVVTPLKPKKTNQMFGRDSFTIHGGLFEGTKGCIELNKNNDKFHTTMRLYKRDFKLIVKYDKRKNP